MHHYQVELTDEQKQSAITTYGPTIKRHMEDGTMSDSMISKFFEAQTPEGKASFLHAKRTLYHRPRTSIPRSATPVVEGLTKAQITERARELFWSHWYSAKDVSDQRKRRDFLVLSEQDQDGYLALKKDFQHNLPDHLPKDQS